MVIIAARPSMGKNGAGDEHGGARRHAQETAGGVLFARNVAGRHYQPHVVRRGAGVDVAGAERQAAARGELDLLHEAGERLDAAPLHIDDASSLSALEMRARARRLKTIVPDLALIIVDYLQLMSGGGTRYDNRSRKSAKSAVDQGTGQGTEIPIVALSQLSRQSEQRRGTKDKLPKLSDLRESGALEQDADVVLFIHREPNQVHPTGAGPHPTRRC